MEVTNLIKVLNEVLYLNLDKWMSPAHCTPDYWFRVFVISCGIIILGTYLSFARKVYFGLKQKLDSIFGIDFAIYLSSTFFCCALVHFLHSIAYTHQYFKIGLLIAYPSLIYSHFRLIWVSSKIISNLKKIKTNTEISVEINEEVEKRVMKFAENLRSFVLSKFAEKENTALYFSDFDPFEVGKEYNLGKGITIILSKNDHIEKILSCSMDKGAVLANHHHPDSFEYFKIISGVYEDRITGKTYKKGDVFKYAPYENHEPFAVKKLELEIRLVLVARDD